MPTHTSICKEAHQRALNNLSILNALRMGEPETTQAFKAAYPNLLNVLLHGNNKSVHMPIDSLIRINQISSAIERYPATFKGNAIFSSSYSWLSGTPLPPQTELIKVINANLPGIYGGYEYNRRIKQRMRKSKSKARFHEIQRKLKKELKDKGLTTEINGIDYIIRAKRAEKQSPYISKQIEKMQFYSWMQLLIIFGLVNRVRYNEPNIPAPMKRNIKHTDKEMNLINWYWISDYSDKSTMETAEQRAAIWVKSGINYNDIRQISMVMLYGFEIGNRPYRHEWQKLSGAANRIMWKLEVEIENEIQNDGYAKKDRVIDNVAWSEPTANERLFKLYMKTQTLYRYKRPTNAEMEKWNLKNKGYIITYR